MSHTYDRYSTLVDSSAWSITNFGCVIFLLDCYPVLGFFGYETDVSNSRYCSNDRKQTDTNCDRQRLPGVREWAEPVKCKDHGNVFYHKQDIGEPSHSLSNAGFFPD